jgi:hypothetical protein
MTAWPGGRELAYETGRRCRQSGVSLKILLVAVAWCLLFVLCWPLAVMTIVLWPLLWLLSLPFRLLATVFEALFALFKAALFLPARLLGHRDRPSARAR